MRQVSTAHNVAVWERIRPFQGNNVKQSSGGLEWNVGSPIHSAALPRITHQVPSVNRRPPSVHRQPFSIGGLSKDHKGRRRVSPKTLRTPISATVLFSSVFHSVKPASDADFTAMVGPVGREAENIATTTFSPRQGRHFVGGGEGDGESGGDQQHGEACCHPPAKLAPTHV